MPRKARLFVEGKADKKFIDDYLNFLLENEPERLDIIPIGGWTEIPKVEPKFKEHSDGGGVNLVIVDADEVAERRRRDILRFQENLGLDFELFLLPNDRDPGNLEVLLCNIINTQHQVIFDCFDGYQECLSQAANYQLPNLKSKIYAYLEALLPRGQRELLKDSKRDYHNVEHWNLGLPYLEPLRDLLLSENLFY